MSTSGISVTESTLPGNQRSKLAGAIFATMNFASSFTDILVHEGETIKLKSAKGIIGIEELKIPNGDLVVTNSYIQQFFSTYVDGQSTAMNAGNYWDEHIVPALARQKAVNRSVQIPDGAFMRFSLFYHNRGKLGMVIRVTKKPPALDSIGLTPQILNRIKNNPSGLLIITGPTASGKTATALSILQWLNENKPGHILTVEDPIEFPMKAQKCVFTQREVGVDVATFGEGLRDAMRHSPDAILAGEVRDRDTAEMAVLGGESGALMIVTTHGRSVTGTLRKILTLTGEMSTAMREVMAGSLIGVIRQQLVPTADERGYVMVSDTLHMTQPVREALESGNWTKLDQITKNDAMASPDFVSMASELNKLAEKNLVTKSVVEQVIGRSDGHS